MADEMQAIVIDNGTYMSKSGFAGDEKPRSIFPTIIGHPRFATAKTNNQTKDQYIGNDASGKTWSLYIKHPIEHGIINNWDYMKQIWHHTFYNELRVDPSEHPVFLTETTMNPKNNREKIIQIMFEQCSIILYWTSVSFIIIFNRSYNRHCF